MRTALALLAAAVVGTGLAWWLDDHPAVVTPPPVPTSTQCWFDTTGMWCEHYPPPATVDGSRPQGEPRP